MIQNKIQNHGYVKDVQAEDHYIFGALGADVIPDEIIREDGQWQAFAPEDEQQNLYVETYNCTGFNTLNPIEILYKEKFGVEKNYSDRAIGILAGTQPPGNSPHVVAESLRKKGVCIEALLPFDSDIQTVDEYYSPNPLSDALLQACLLFLDELDFKHDWVFEEGIPLKDKQDKLKEALKRSPLGVSVYAWQKDTETGFYEKDGEDNHWTCLIGYVEGSHWVVFDSYGDDGSYIKELLWDYDFGMAKRYWIGKKNSKNGVDVLPPPPVRVNWLVDLVINIWDFVAYFFRGK